MAKKKIEAANGHTKSERASECVFVPKKVDNKLIIKYNFTLEQFVLAFKNSTSLDEVTTKLKIPEDKRKGAKKYISVLATQLRKKGVNLKRFSSKQVINKDKLNKLLEESGNG